MSRMILLLVLLGTSSLAWPRSFATANATSPWVSTYSSNPVPGDGITPSVGGPSFRLTAVILTAWNADFLELRESLNAKRPLTPEQENLLPFYRRVVKNHYFDLAGSDKVIIQVAYVGPPRDERAISDFWTTKTHAEMLRRITMVRDGERVSPVAVRSHDKKPMNVADKVYWIVVGFQAVFPRHVEGKPLFALGMKKVYLEVDGPFEKVKLPFDVKKMVVRGELLY